MNAGDVKVFCVNDNQTFSFFENPSAEGQKTECTPSADGVHSFSQHSALRCLTECTAFADASLPDFECKNMWLFEPNASLMKAGCFRELARCFQLLQIAPNSHLFLAEHNIPNFPGRCFRVVSVSSMNKKKLKRHLAGLSQANIATRNFPLSVAELRKRLKIKEGGDIFIFATTLADGSHTLFFCEKEGRSR